MKEKKDFHYEFQCTLSDMDFKQINKHKQPVTTSILIMRSAEMNTE